MNRNRKGFLDMIAWSEIGTKLLAESDNGYNVLVGGTLFTGYLDHPRIKVKVRDGLWSTAAGRYQILERYYDHYKQQLGLPDFGHDSQDRIALQLIRECQALTAIDLGQIELAIRKCRSRWASFPGAGYDQHENSMAKMLTAYSKAGGTFGPITA